MADSNTSEVHLCVMVHGLWGHPHHLDQVAAALREAYPDEFLQIIIPKTNAGNSTYDGIERGGERVAREIEEEVETIAKSGREVKKISMVGYSLGGLVARYTVGLLYSNGFFEKVQPINFTTFATPHLGVRTPLVGWHNDLWNKFGGSTLSVSGQQLFTIDSFRETGKPLLSLLADPGSVFIRGLASFKHRSLYANVINDRAVPFYTAFITAKDPFVNIDAVDCHYVPGYEEVILDAKLLATPKTKALTTQEWIASSANNALQKAPLYLFFGVVLIPIGSIAYLANAGIQSYRSAQRIKLHEEGKEFGSYRTPLMVEAMQRKTEAAFEAVNSKEDEEYLPEEDEEDRGDSSLSSSGAATPDSTAIVGKNSEAPTTMQAKDGEDFPTLALTPDQFAMVESLNKTGFDKHAVYIHKAPHSHAAIVRRTTRSAFSEGKIVAKHWCERFEL